MSTNSRRIEKNLNEDTSVSNVAGIGAGTQSKDEIGLTKSMSNSYKEINKKQTLARLRLNKSSVSINNI